MYEIISSALNIKCGNKRPYYKKARECKILDYKREELGNFFIEKISNLSGASLENITYSNIIFGEFCQKLHGKNTDKMIIEARKDEDSDEFVLEVLQEWVNHH